MSDTKGTDLLIPVTAAQGELTGLRDWACDEYKKAVAAADLAFKRLEAAQEALSAFMRFVNPSLQVFNP
jgi:hypothetical protein